MKVTRKVTGKVTRKVTRKFLLPCGKTLLSPIRELQEDTGLSECGVKKVIRQLKAEGLISRIGGDKGGHWEVAADCQGPF